MLLQAINTLPEDSFSKLIIAGKSSYQYDTSNLKESIRKKIEIIDAFLSQQEIITLFNQSHILIMPYLEASQSGVAAVGIANAMPTICTDVGGLKEQFILANSNGGGGQMINSVPSFANPMPMTLLLVFYIYQRIKCFITALATTLPFWRKA